MDVYEVTLIGIASVLSILISRFAYQGFIAIASPTLLRLFLAFLLVGLGFIVLELYTLGIDARLFLLSLIVQAMGYFFLAFSYSIQSLTFRYMIPLIALISVALSPLFVIPGDSIEHIIRSISFVLIVYGATNTMLAYMSSKNVNTLITMLGLSSLALGEFVSWYSFLYPESLFYKGSLALKVSGLAIILLPIYLSTLRGVKVGSDV